MGLDSCALFLIVPTDHFVNTHVFCGLAIISICPMCVIVAGLFCSDKAISYLFSCYLQYSSILLNSATDLIGIVVVLLLFLYFL